MNRCFLFRNGKWHAIGIVRDITARKQAEAQIDEQLSELRRWYEATLGQGMRAIELKREVNELLKQAGHAFRPDSTIHRRPRSPPSLQLSGGAVARVRAGAGERGGFS